jgi:hypothetical protein
MKPRLPESITVDLALWRLAKPELAQALLAGQIIEDYPADPRGASALVLGHTAAGRPLHAVCGFDPGGDLLLITVYEPSMPWWRDEHTRNG